MRLSWNEIRARAAHFAREWEGHGYEKGETQLFYRDLFEVFGMPVRRVATFEEPVRNLGDRRGFIDLFWKGVLLVEQKSRGRDRVRAKQQALDYFPGLKNSELPRYVLVSDFQSFDLYDLEQGTDVSFALSALPMHVEKFGFIIGVEARTFRDQDPVNVEASEMMGALHDALEASGYTGHDLEQFLVRLVFCLFADDTGIFEPKDTFLDYLTSRTSEDGSDLGARLIQVFQVLNTPEDARARNLDEDLARLPYVNGDLFAGRLAIPSFDASMRQQLLDACQFDWSAISPAIFGALFQSVMNPEERRAQGAHYTTERNILKVIEPLFLDDLRAEFRRLRARKDKGRRKALHDFQARLAKLTFFDPACGCGNFLVIAYRELRSLELELIRELRGSLSREQVRLDLSLINVDQFYGIELGEFPARIAETAMWMMDHIMNNRLSLEIGESYVRLPLKRSPHITHGDALETDWNEVLPGAQCSYVYGNPPFVGSKFQSEQQRAQVRRIAGLGGSGGSLDYVAAWFLKAGAYVQGGTAAIGFVATNSITQGEQVGQLWPLLFERYGLEISFAHRTFAWGSDARGKAHVHVVILGLCRRSDAPMRRRLFSYPDINGDPHESDHAAISPYLFDASRLANPHVVVREESRPINGLPQLIIGSKPIDGGNYIFTEEERAAFLAVEPRARRFMHPFVGSREFLHEGHRHILWLGDAEPEELRELPHVRERIARVRAYRLASDSAPTKALAATPTRYHVNVVPKRPFLVVPEVSSERREYIPIAWLEPPVIPSNKVRILQDAELWQFALLTSEMHMAWVRGIGGRLESRFQYGIGIIYNTLPVPNVRDASALEDSAKKVLAARAAHPDSTLSDLYDPDLMPADLRRAHSALDRAVDRLYRREKFTGDSDRVEYLLGMYEKMAVPLAAPTRRARQRRVR
ncbi:MAG TPA: DNA methyltransferase [Gemmatimonadales bacterium]|nr:DNA methyltransferase [Gemmatimonadales bacterium]